MNYFFLYSQDSAQVDYNTLSLFLLYISHIIPIFPVQRIKNWMKRMGGNSKGCFHRMSFTVIRTRHERTKKRNKKKETVKKRKSKEMKISFLSFCYCCCCCLFKNLPKVKFFLARFQCLFIFIWRFIQWDMREWKRNIAERGERGKSTQKNVVMRI